MAERHAVLFCEDLGHESFARPLLRRLGREEGVDVVLDVKNSRGGIGRATSELRAWQRFVALRGDRPDLLLVILDANSDGPATRRRQVQDVIDGSLFPHVVVGTPDPYVERWYFADEAVFRTVAGGSPPGVAELAHSRRARKNALRRSMEASGEFLLNDVADLAPEIVGQMDLYAAARAVPTLGQLVQDLRMALRASTR